MTEANVWWAPRNTFTGDMREDRKPHGQGRCVNEIDKSSYDGSWKDGKRHGQGRMTFTDGAERNGRKEYQGMWVDDNLTGEGKAEWENGLALKGEFRDNCLQPEREYTLVIPKTKRCLATRVKVFFERVPGTDLGHYIWGPELNPVKLVYEAQWFCPGAEPGRFSASDYVTYTGASEGFMPHGKGRMEWPDQSFYEGDWREGLRHGRGLHRYVDRGGPGGGEYEGEWAAFNCATHMHGKGTARWLSASGHVTRVFEGELRRNCPINGTLKTFAGGIERVQRVRYSGQTYIWDPRLQPSHTQEELVQVGAGLYEGERNDRGMPHGRGMMEFDDGSYFEGRWEGGEMSGGGRLIFASSSLGESYDGQMRTSLFDGRGRLLWKGGALFDGMFEHGCPLYGYLTVPGIVRTYVWYDGRRSWDDPELRPSHRLEAPEEEQESEVEGEKKGHELWIQVAKAGVEVGLEVISIFPGAGLVLKAAGSVCGKVKKHLARQNEGRRCLLWCRTVQSLVEMTVTLSPHRRFKHEEVKGAIELCQGSFTTLETSLQAVLGLLPASNMAPNKPWYKKAAQGPKWLYCKLKNVFSSAEWNGVRAARERVKKSVEGLYDAIHQPEHSALPLKRLKQLLDETECLKLLTPEQLKEWEATLSTPASRILHPDARSFWLQHFSHDENAPSHAVEAALVARGGEEAAVLQAMRYLDKNCDGVISIEEFNEWTIFQGIPL